MTKAGFSNDTAKTERRVDLRSRGTAIEFRGEANFIFDALSFRRDNLTASDRFLALGIQYIRRYPRAHPGRELIR